jgi:hypothetical protein
MLTFPNLQKVVNEDRWHRFELLYEPLKGRDDESWWIRVKNMNVRFFVLGGSMLPSLNRSQLIGKIYYNQTDTIYEGF